MESIPEKKLISSAKIPKRKSSLIGSGKELQLDRKFSAPHLFWLEVTSNVLFEVPSKI